MSPTATRSHIAAVSGISLEDTVDSILVDPADPNLVIVSALGDATHHGGIYRSTDGGQSWTRVLRPDGYDGIREVEYAYDDPSDMLAATQSTGGNGQVLRSDRWGIDTGGEPA